MSLFIKKVKNLIIAKDKKDWDTVRSFLSDKKNINYTFLGQEMESLTSDELIDRWVSFTNKYTHTHYQIGNTNCSSQSEFAKVSCYVTAKHYKENPEGNIWTVYGDFEVEMEKEIDEFRITAIKFFKKFEDGNLEIKSTW